MDTDYEANISLEHNKQRPTKAAENFPQNPPTASVRGEFACFAIPHAALQKSSDTTCSSRVDSYQRFSPSSHKAILKASRHQLATELFGKITSPTRDRTGGRERWHEQRKVLWVSIFACFEAGPHHEEIEVCCLSLLSLSRSPWGRTRILNSGPSANRHPHLPQPPMFAYYTLIAVNVPLTYDRTCRHRFAIPVPQVLLPGSPVVPFPLAATPPLLQLPLGRTGCCSALPGEEQRRTYFACTGTREANIFRKKARWFQGESEMVVAWVAAPLDDTSWTFHGDMTDFWCLGLRGFATEGSDINKGILCRVCQTFTSIVQTRSRLSTTVP